MCRSVADIVADLYHSNHTGLGLLDELSAALRPAEPDPVPPPPAPVDPEPPVTPPVDPPAPPPVSTRPIMTDAQAGTLGRLLAMRHPELVEVQGMADRANAYGDVGQFDTILYFATGDPARAQAAIRKILATMPADPGNANDTREYLTHYALHYAWLRDLMSPADRAEIERRLVNWAGYCWDLGPVRRFGTRLGDSDVVVGHYFGLRLLATLIDDVAEMLAYYAPGPNGSTLEAQRKAIATFCDVARGGEWVESSGYNPGTLMLLFLGASAVGMEEFPEVSELGQEVAEWLPWTFTPDIKQGAEWGDDSWPRDQEQHGQVIGLCAMLAGLGLDPTGSARALRARLTAGLTPYAYYHHLCRGLLYFDPSGPVPAVPEPKGFRAAEGVGLFIHRGRDHLLSVYAPNRTYVDHEIAHCCDVRLWFGGEWVLDHPMATVNPGPESINGARLSGLGRLWNYGAESYSGRTDGAVVSWQTAGPYTWPGYYDAPPPFVDLYRRTVNFVAPQVVAVEDTFKGSDPLTLPKLDRYYPDVKTRLESRRGLWEVVWHCPVEPTATDSGFVWQTPGGKSVRLDYSADGRSVRAEVLETSPANTQGTFNPVELTGWQIRLLSDDPAVTITTTITVEG